MGDESTLFAEISAEIPADTPEAAVEKPASNVEEVHAGETLLPDEELTTLPVPEHSELAAEGPEPQLEVPQAALPEPLTVRTRIRIGSGF